MPSRRTVLGSAAAATSVLAGCTRVSGGVDGTHAFDHDGLSLPAEDATVAASDSVVWMPDGGYVEADGYAHELADAIGFVLETRYRVEAHDEQNHHGLRTEHGCVTARTPSIVTFDSNTRRTDDDPQFRLEATPGARSVEWDLERVEPARTAEYRFATRFENVAPEPGTDFSGWTSRPCTREMDRSRAIASPVPASRWTTARGPPRTGSRRSDSRVTQYARTSTPSSVPT